MWLNPQFPGDLVTSPKEILNGKLHFLCSAAAIPLFKSLTEAIYFCIQRIIFPDSAKFASAVSLDKGKPNKKEISSFT